MTGRTFTVSIKPCLERNKIQEFVSSMKGSATVWAINHTEDVNDFAEIVEPHTHFLIEYESPRKLSTVANLFQVEDNFIEVVKSKKSMLRYLTHMDNLDKFQYDGKDVITNANIDYETAVLGSSLSDRDIAEYLKQGRGQELFDLVSMSRLKLIQSFLNYERQGITNAELKRLNEKMDNMSSHIENINSLVVEFKDALLVGASKLGTLGNGFVMEIKTGFSKIATEINKARMIKK